jgi:hypothetical protein
MDPATFQALQPLLDKVAQIAERQLGAPDLIRAFSGLSQAVGTGLTVSINMTVDVFDEAHERALPLLTTGLSVDYGREPHRTWGDSSPQRYVVDEGIQVVPHDRCPKCWEVWDFKLQNPTCSHCGATLGENCKLLLDTDECPWCQEGKVTVSQPRCNQCGFVVDPRFAVWG